jgi:cell wall-active antibiotic response 4TMS protein YvqF
MDKSEKKERGRRQKTVSRLVMGVLLVFVGMLFLLDNLGVWEAGQVFRYWPLALMAMGVPALIAPKDTADPAWGITLTSAGLFFLLRELDVIDWSIRDIWPVFLIVAGLVLLIGALGRKRRGASMETMENGGVR